MAGSYNRITLVGNLTRDPEIRYVDGGGKAVTKFALAINRKSKAGDETMYVDIVAWDRLGEICNQYLKKGMSALVEGRLVIRDFTNKDGEKKKAIEVVASDMQMLDSKSRSEGGGSSSYNNGGGASRPAAPAAVGGGHDGFEDDGMDGEIPF
ncbi:MAG: single-stranded DNA-binding protein [Candidatus Eremiobacteraeota bacterium]|nr:single-stranded DNA-binding protein [Candidatus Eremiobacteraeota bacterium]